MNSYPKHLGWRWFAEERHREGSRKGADVVNSGKRAPLKSMEPAKSDIAPIERAQDYRGS